MGVGGWVVGTRSWVVGRGSWVLGGGSWVVGHEPKISHVYPSCIRILCCFKCPLATAVFSTISFTLELNIHCIFSSHISMYTSYYIALVQ